MKTIKALIIFFILAIATWAILVEPDRLVVTRATINIANLPKEYKGLKILLIGDVHAGSLFIDENKLNKIVELSNNEKPDIAFFVGDFVVEGAFESEFINPNITAKILSQIKTKYGLIAILGNHDWWYSGDKTTNALKSNGFIVLENDAVKIAKNNKNLWIAGLADNIERQPDISKAVKKAKANEPVILITHEPDIFANFNNMPKQVKLVLAGHTHGGQVRLPFIGALVVPSAYGNKYAKGYINENDKQMYVTSGIGTSIFPIRFLCPPEIVVLKLK